MGLYTNFLDTTLHGIPAGALAPDQDEQRDRAHQPRDQAEDESRRDLPGRQLGPDAGDGEAEVHRGARMGQEEVPGHVEAGGDGRAEQEGGGLEQGGAEAASINLRKNLDGTPPLRISGMQTTTTNVNTIAMISAERPMRYAPADEMKPPTQAERA